MTARRYGTTSLALRGAISREVPKIEPWPVMDDNVAPCVAGKGDGRSYSRVLARMYLRTVKDSSSWTLASFFA